MLDAECNSSSFGCWELADDDNVREKKTRKVSSIGWKPILATRDPVENI